MAEAVPNSPRGAPAHNMSGQAASDRLAQANEGLHQLGVMLRSHDCFDNEDLRTWQEEVQRFEEVDKELLALQQHLPERQRLMAALDEAYALSHNFPHMMKKFAAKDADLQGILDTKLRQQRERGAGTP